MSGLTGQNLGPRRGPTPIQPDLEEEKKLDDAVAQYLDGCTFMYDMMTGKYPYMMDMDGKDVVFESNGVGHSALEAFKVVSDFDAKHVNDCCTLQNAKKNMACMMVLTHMFLAALASCSMNDEPSPAEKDVSEGLTALSFGFEHAMKGTLEDLKEILQLHESCGTKVAQNENFEEYQNQVFKRSRDTLQSYLQALQKLTSHWASLTQNTIENDTICLLQTFSIIMNTREARACLHSGVTARRSALPTFTSLIRSLFRGHGSD